MNSDKQIQLYLEGSLKGNELAMFRKKLKEDEAFKALFMDYQKAWNLIEKQHRKLSLTDRFKENLRMSRDAISVHQIREDFGEFLTGNERNASDEEKFKAILTAHMKKRSRKNRSIGFILTMAAGILLLVGLPLTLNMSKESRNSSRLFDQYYAPYPYFLHERSLLEKDSSLNEKAMYLYNIHDYTGAASILEKNITDSLTNPIQDIYLGICFMEMKEYNNAVKTFESIISAHHYITYSQANWYMGLTYLKMNRRNKATEYLVKVKSDSCLFTRQAIEILDKLNQK
jgi:tetratricopeptide (TPR) repeat protein